MSSTTTPLPIDAIGNPASSTRNISAELSERIALARIALILGIVVLHVPPYQSLTELGTAPLEIAKAFFSGALFRSALPLLTMISAFLLFAREQDSYLSLVRKKSLSLLLPLIIWNAPLAIAIYGSQRFGLVDYQFSTELHPATAEQWLNAILALGASPANYPLYFLRDLFVLALLSPIFLLLFKRAPVLGLFLTVGIALSGADGLLIIRNDLLIAFYLGGLVAVHRVDLSLLDRHAWVSVFLLSFICAAIVSFDLETGPFVRIPAAVLMWSAIGLLCQSKLGRFLTKHADASFLIFVTHAPLLAIFWTAYKKVLPSVPYGLFWVAAPLLCACIGLAGNQALRRFAPELRKILVGRQ